MMGAVLRLIFPVLLVMALVGCANIVPPDGGEKDVTPPKLLSVTPSDSGLNTRIRKLEMTFDEYIVLNDAASQVQISPLLSIPLTVTAKLKRVTVSIPDSLLLDATTYRITFGTAIRDLHEGNVYESKGYTFSTGDHFDSLSLAGTVYSSNTGLHDSAAHVMLYAAADNDSAVVRHKPMYVTHVDGLGNFSFQGLPARPFRLYALRDGNTNLTFDGGGEWIAFYDSILTPAFPGRTDIELRTFPETLGEADSSKGREQDARFKADAAPKGSRIPAGGYVVGVDTSDSKRRTQELNDSLRLIFGRKLAGTINPAKVFLSYDSAGTTVEVPVRIAADTTGLQYWINTPWREDALYTLRLQKGFAQDSNGTDMLPGRYSFRTKRDEDYGKLRIHLPTKFYGRGHILQVVSDRDTLYQQAVTDTMVALLRTPPGTYTMRIIVDKNQNGRWDAGDLFLRRQPELVIPYNNSINLKPGWEQQIDFNEPRRRSSLGDAADRRR
jgi:hypothetical protein